MKRLIYILFLVLFALPLHAQSEETARILSYIQKAMNFNKVVPQEKVYLHFDNGMSLHQFKYETNLFDDDGAMTYIRLYNDDGHYVLDGYFDKKKVMYDINRGATIIPAEGIKLDFKGFENNKETNPYRNAKPLYMSFQRRAAKNLHYVL